MDGSSSPTHQLHIKSINKKVKKGKQSGVTGDRNKTHKMFNVALLLSHHSRQKCLSYHANKKLKIMTKHKLAGQLNILMA